MSGGLLRMLRWALLGICVTGMIAIFGLYKYQVKIVKMTTIIMPGEPNVQIKVPFNRNNTQTAVTNMTKQRMFVTAVCLLFLLKLKWPKNKSF